MVQDFLIAGLGSPWIEYEAKVTKQEIAPGLMTDVIADQRALLKQVPWKRFHWEPGKDWEDVDWVARDHYLTKREIKEQFGKDPDSEAVRTEDDEKTGTDKYANHYRVTEIWNRIDRKVYVIGWDFSEPLEVRDDKLMLADFFPCPRPMLANVNDGDDQVVRVGADAGSCGVRTVVRLYQQAGRAHPLHHRADQGGGVLRCATWRA